MLSEKFIDLLNKLEVYLSKENIQLYRFQSKNLPYFPKLTEAQQMFVITQLKTLVEIAEELQNENKKISHSANLIELFLKKSNLHVPRYVLEQIKETDLVDIYNRESRMLITSVSILMLTTYSFEELYCRPWSELFSRDADIHQQIFHILRSILNGEITTPVDVTYIRPHKVAQTYSTDGLFIIAQHILYCPVYSDHGIAGTLSISRVLEKGYEGTH